MCSFSVMTQIRVKYITGQLDDFWFDFTSWKNGLGRTKTARERKRNNPSLPLLILSPLFVNSFFFRHCVSLCSFTLKIFVAGCWGWVVTFHISVMNVFLLKNLQMLCFIPLIIQVKYYERLNKKLFLSQQACTACVLCELSL